jgi:uncharacterized protein YyaL (SSP411 family)
MTNRLAGETSPCLLQHAHNPVDWYPWGAEALERARAEDRPIFLSIGYAACHWCHVMERESFEDAETAALMNEHFVSIKVDREERPDLDDVYMAAVQAMTGSGGWPMNVFLTPQLEPFFGGTYFPPQDRHGLPSFRQVLTSVADAYRTRRAEVDASARQLAQHVRGQLAVDPGSVDPDRAVLDQAVRRLGESFDATHGGWGTAPKFPAPMTIEFLLRSWRHSGAEATLGMAVVTLDAMAAGGLRDQLGGGFARYSTDGHWLVPHFEKMLTDNALLAHAYLEAYRATGEARHRDVALDTLRFCLRELRTSDGGYASALDADSEGSEGRFYVWTDTELRSVLADAGLDGTEIDAVAGYWGVTPGGNWEGRSILHLADPGAAPAALVERARAPLLATREARPRPGRDDKQVAASNGMALRAFASAALVTGEPWLFDATRDLVAFVRATLLRDGDRVWRTARDGRASTPGFAEDYAALIDGLLAAHAALGDASCLDLALRLARRLVTDFWDETAGTLVDSGPEHEVAVTRPRSLIDGATPAANSMAADLFARLALLAGDEDLDRRARSIVRAVAPALARQPTMFGRMLSAVDRLISQPIDVVVAAGSEDAEAGALRRSAMVPYQPNLVLASVAPGDAHGAWPLFADKLPRDGRATAYACRGYACDAPTSDPAELHRQVAALQSA